MRTLQVFPWRETDALVALGQQLVEFIVVAALIYLIGRVLVVPATGWLLDLRSVEPTMASATCKAVQAGVAVIALVIAAEFAGFARLLGGSALLAAALTVAIGFAAQDVIANFAAGAFIVHDRHFNIGDWIEWDEHVGVIEDISFRTTRIRTFDNELVTVPNTELATSVVTNRMSGDILRVTAEFGIEYGADLEAVRELLLAVADEHPAILEEPEPSVQFMALAGDSIDVQARFWIAEPDRREFLTVRSAFLEAAVDRLLEAGVEVGTETDLDLTGELEISSGELRGADDRSRRAG